MSGGARQMAQEKQRRRVGPVPVLDHEQRGPTAREVDEQVGYGRVQPMALGVRIGIDGRRQVADPHGEIRKETRQFAAAGAERGS